MESIWIVTKSCPSYTLVDDDLNVIDCDPGKICGVFKTRKGAVSYINSTDDGAEFEYSITQYDIE